MPAATALGGSASLNRDRFQSTIINLADHAFRVLDRIARRCWLASAFVALLPVVLRLSVLHFVPIPQPVVHDEFSYLLGAETFASGHITNPTPKMWVFFETFHENFQPTYSTKYPPGQSLVLAAGTKLFGHPWFGVVLSFGVMSACLCWMLQGWLPRRLALLAALVAVAQIGVFGYWMNSYWGGAVNAIGGALLCGAVPRLARRASVLPAALAALGLVIIANTRPFEGLVAAVGCFAVLLWWRRQKGQPLRDLFRPAILLPVLLIGAAGGAATGYYNYRLTGDPLLLPYVVNQRAYSTLNYYFYILPPKRQLPVYRHEPIRKLWVEDEGADYWKDRHNPLRAVVRELSALTFVFSPLIFLGFAAGVILSRDTRIRLALVILGAVLFVLSLEVSSLAHYYAPVIGLFFVPVAVALQRLKTRGGAFGAALVLLFLLAAFGPMPWDALQVARNARTSTTRQAVIAQLQHEGGRHLVIVRYSPDHNQHDEVVFNHADIDNSDIVWARDMGDTANRELLNYYAGRRVWLLEPDRSRVAQPYASQ
jgi:hypothetical protein